MATGEQAPAPVKFLAAYKDWVSVNGKTYSWDEFRELQNMPADHVVVNIFYLASTKEFGQVLDNLKTMYCKAEFTGKGSVHTVAAPAQPQRVERVVPEDMWACPTCLTEWPKDEVPGEWKEAGTCSECT